MNRTVLITGASRGIGAATARIPAGGWVHLHCMGSKFDEKSNKLDPLTGTSVDTRY